MRDRSIGRERGWTNQETRRRHFAINPLCAMCEAAGRVTLAKELDHIVALVNGGTNDPSNRQGLCEPCHKAKTAQDMGWKPKRQIGPDGWPV